MNSASALYGIAEQNNKMYFYIYIFVQVYNVKTAKTYIRYMYNCEPLSSPLKLLQLWLLKSSVCESPGTTEVLIDYSYTASHLPWALDTPNLDFDSKKALLSPFYSHTTTSNLVD